MLDQTGSKHSKMTTAKPYIHISQLVGMVTIYSSLNDGQVNEIDMNQVPLKRKQKIYNDSCHTENTHRPISACGQNMNETMPLPMFSGLNYAMKQV